MSAAALTERTRVPQSEPDYRELVERAGDLIYTLDLEGRFTFVNANGLRLVGYEREELVGAHFLDVLAPASRPVALDHFRRGVRGEDVPPFFEVEAIRKDGSVVDLEIRAGDLFEDGELAGRQGIARNITQLKRLQAEVAEKSQRLTLLAERELALAAAEELGLGVSDVRILELLADGCSNREIAAQVHLSPNTVKDRVSKLMRLLGARSRAGVVAQAARRGLIPSAR